MKPRGLLVILTLVIFLLVPSFAMADELFDEGLDQERIDLFVASQRMLVEDRKPPHMRVGMVITNLGEDREVSVGAKVEANLDSSGTMRLVTETIYLKEENTLAGFMSLKLVPFTGVRLPVYFGGGAGYAIDGFRYQVFAGAELTKNLYAEMRYINMPGGFGDTGLYFATGFQFTY